MDDKGFFLLTGDVGTGKTTLINTFVESLGDDIIVSRVSDPGLTQFDFINYIAKLFKIETAFNTKSEFLILFTTFLEQAHEDDKKVLLIIDEAQHLTDGTLEEIRLLSNIENQDKKLLNIFLVGQNEFNETIEKHKNRALRQRITLNYTLYPFAAEETKACIKYRLRVAGAEDEIFEPEAIDVIHTISNGFPRVINIICDHALRLGCQEDQEVISAAIVNQCSNTLQVAHRPQSHQYGNHFGTANEWLEESEVPPLSPEAINRISQPLPDLILETEIEETPRPYSAKRPLILVALLIFGFFLFKGGNLTSVSKFLTSMDKDTIISTAKEKGNGFLDIVQKIEKLLFSKTISASSNVPTPPVIIAKTQNEHIVEVYDSGNFPQTEISETDLQTSNQKQQTITTSEKILADINTEPEPSFAPIPTITEETIVDEPEAQSEYVSVNVEIKEPIPLTSNIASPERSKMTEVLSDDVQGDDNDESEVISEPPIPPLSETPAIVEKAIEKEKQSAPQSKVESVPQDIDSTVVQSKVPSDPQTPTTSKEASDKNDDPGAVIDWLLKSKQN